MFEFLAQLANANGKQKRRASVLCQRTTTSPRKPQMNAFVLIGSHRRWRNPSVNLLQSACQLARLPHQNAMRPSALTLKTPSGGAPCVNPRCAGMDVNAPDKSGHVVVHSHCCGAPISHKAPAMKPQPMKPQPIRSAASRSCCATSASFCCRFIAIERKAR